MRTSVVVPNREHKDESPGRYILNLLVPLQVREAHMYLTSSVLSVSTRQHITFQQRDACITRSKNTTPPGECRSQPGGKGQTNPFERVPPYAINTKLRFLGCTTTSTGILLRNISKMIRDCMMSVLTTSGRCRHTSH